MVLKLALKPKRRSPSNPDRFSRTLLASCHTFRQSALVAHSRSAHVWLKQTLAESCGFSWVKRVTEDRNLFFSLGDVGTCTFRDFPEGAGTCLMPQFAYECVYEAMTTHAPRRCPFTASDLFCQLVQAQAPQDETSQHARAHMYTNGIKFVSVALPT
jgi:hypothetical protein